MFLSKEIKNDNLKKKGSKGNNIVFFKIKNKNIHL